MKKLYTALLCLAFAVPALRAEIVAQILVKVNGEIFTKTDLEQRQVAILRQRGQQIDLKSEAGNQQLRKALDEITPQLLVDVIDEMLIVQRGKDLGYKLSDEQFKQVVDNIKKENKIENDEQLQAALKAENMTMADLRRNLERTMMGLRTQQLTAMGAVQDLQRTQMMLTQSGATEQAAEVTRAIQDLQRGSGDAEKTLIGTVLNLDSGKR